MASSKKLVVAERVWVVGGLRLYIYRYIHQISHHLPVTGSSFEADLLSLKADRDSLNLLMKDGQDRQTSSAIVKV